MELFDIATKIEYLAIKAENFCCLAAEVSAQRDGDRPITALADVFEWLSKEATELSEAVYEEARKRKDQLIGCGYKARKREITARQKGGYLDKLKT